MRMAQPNNSTESFKSFVAAIKFALLHIAACRFTTCMNARSEVRSAVPFDQTELTDERPC